MCSVHGNRWIAKSAQNATVATLKNSGIHNEVIKGGREGTRIYAALKAIQPV